MQFDKTISGRVVTPLKVIDNGCIGIKSGKIAKVDKIKNFSLSINHSDFGNSFIFPGIIDGQTHSGSYLGFKGIESTSRSAICGGITTIVDMPYDNPSPITNIDLLREKIRAIKEFAICDIALYGTVLPGEGISKVGRMIDSGIVAIKVSSIENHPTRFPRIPLNEILSLFDFLSSMNIPLGLHNEDQEIVDDRLSYYREKKENNIFVHSKSRPLTAELGVTAHFLELGALSNAHAHIVHLSHSRGFKIVNNYRNEGFKATGELCVHYLWFDPKIDGGKLGSLMKVNPPIREGENNSLWKALTDGKVSFVSSDHSSWPLENKNTSSILDAGPGIPGLETLLPCFYTVAKKNKHPKPELITSEFLSERPAKFFGLWPQKGSLNVGSDADFCVFLPKEQVWDSKNANDGLNWSPFDGYKFNGQVSKTFLRGECVWDGKKFLLGKKTGQFIPRRNSNFFDYY